MAFFNKIGKLKVQNPLRDRNREEFCTVLQGLGVKAQMAMRGRPEERVSSKRGRIIRQWGIPCGWVSRGDSLGIIDITGASNLYVNILIYQFEDSLASHYYVYCVPDARIHTKFPKIRIRLAPVRKSWMGEMIGLKWKGKDCSLGIIEGLCQNTSVTKAILGTWQQESYASIEIASEPAYGCWSLTTNTIPTREEGGYIQSIANHLLVTPIVG